MRGRALERLGETRKRNEGEKPEEKKAATKRSRRSGGDTKGKGRGRLRNQDAGEERKKTTANLHETGRGNETAAE